MLRIRDTKDPVHFAGSGSQNFSTDPDPDLNLTHFKNVNTKIKFPKFNKMSTKLPVTKCIKKNFIIIVFLFLEMIGYGTDEGSMMKNRVGTRDEGGGMRY